MGKDDGDKTAREAEQLAAMGKLSELLGKRAKDVSGELMVEVAGGNQQLKTAYSGKVGAHAEAGGEITRDEVPMMYRDFVQQYFERVRKTPPPAAKAKAASGPGEQANRRHPITRAKSHCLRPFASEHPVRFRIVHELFPLSIPFQRASGLQGDVAEVSDDGGAVAGLSGGVQSLARVGPLPRSAAREPKSRRWCS
jgi:hypothetical protein